MSVDTSKLILDLAASIGTAAKRENIDKSQLENVAASLEFYEHERYSLLVTIAYALRQETRGYLRRGTAQAVTAALKELYAKGMGKNEARQVLGLAKWIYEAAQRIYIEEPVQTIDQFLELVRKRGS